MHQPNNLWHLVARHLSHEATIEESNALKKMMEEDPYLPFSMEVLTHFWESNQQENNTVSSLRNDQKQIPGQ